MREIADVRFGVEKPAGDSGCVPWVGEYDPLDEFHYWVYDCTTRREQGARSDLYYLLGDAESPTRERARFVIVAPPHAKVADWEQFQSSLLNDLARELRIPQWRERHDARFGLGYDHVVEATLFVSRPISVASRPSRFQALQFPSASPTHYGQRSEKDSVRETMRPIGSGPQPVTWPRVPAQTEAVVESLVVNCFSEQLEHATREAEWDLRDDGDSTAEVAYGFPEFVPDGLDDVMRALRARRPALASALEATPIDSTSIHGVDALLAASLRTGNAADHDLALYATHLWANRLLAQLQGNPPSDCAAGSPAQVQVFNTLFSRYRSTISCDHYAAWWYTGGFIDSTVARAGSNRWADYAFLNRTRDGWSLEYGCDQDIGSDQFRPVITRGEAFLRAHPGSVIAAELRLLIAEAHETAWSLGKSNPGDESVPAATYAYDAPFHRVQAMRLYERQLHERRDDPRNAAVRRRLARMKLDVDSGFRRFYCSNE